MEHPERKRLPEYDYSNHGAYFLTLCTRNKAELFGEPERKTVVQEMLYRVFAETLAGFPGMTCPKLVVMPNHIHALVMINASDGKRNHAVADMMRAFKSKSTVEYIRLVKSGVAQPFEGKQWQRSYYDHIIRNQRDFDEIWNYIDANPARWKTKKQ